MSLYDLIAIQVSTNAALYISLWVAFFVVIFVHQQRRSQ